MCVCVCVSHTQIIDYNMSTKARATKKVTPVLGGFDKSKYTTLRLWATAKDGVKVPISLVYRCAVHIVRLSDARAWLGFAHAVHEQ